MEAHPDDVTAADDLTLVDAARAGDRLAFGVLYLRHHAAAWRVACVVSRFSPDAELAVIEGFTRVFSALPRKSEGCDPEGESVRPYLLACVRQSALDRARTAGRAKASPAPLAGLAPDGELVLSSLEHHVVREALASLPERARTTLWLAEVEALTPTEIASLLGGGADEVAELVSGARKDLHAASQAVLCGHEVRAGCRFTVDNLESYQAGILDPANGVLVRSHLDDCPTCRMRLGELANGPATLAAAAPAVPLLGGEAQHRWLTSIADVRPAARWLPPVLAAATPSDLPMPARRLAAVAAGLPGMARRAGHRVRHGLPVVALVVAWLAVMVSLPQLMQPATAPGPAGLALPAVQAYVPDYLPGSGATRRTGTSPTAPPSPGDDARAGGGTELAIRFDADGVAGPAPAREPAVKLVATTTAGARRTAPRTRRPSPAPVVATVPPATVTAAVPAVTIPAVIPATIEPVASTVPPATTPVTPVTGTKPSKALEALQRRLEELDRKLRAEAASLPNGELDIASLRSTVREEFDGRVARRTARRRHTDHAESA